MNYGHAHAPQSVADIMGVIGRAVVSTQLLGVDSYAYWQHSREDVGSADLFAGVFKSFFFGAATTRVITSPVKVGCFGCLSWGRSMKA